MNELLLKINQMVQKLNNTFVLTPITENDQETDGIKIESLKNDGTEFTEEFLSFFNDIINSVDENYELIYNPEKGLIMVKKIIKIEYEIVE